MKCRLDWLLDIDYLTSVYIIRINLYIVRLSFADCVYAFLLRSADVHKVKSWSKTGSNFLHQKK